MKPHVSIVIPTYNCSAYIQTAIESVFTQKYKNYELIVVDDGSSDGTERILAQYEDKLKYIKIPKSGVSAARNAGIKNAIGDLVAFLDADDVWNPHKLSMQIEFMHKKKINAIFSNFCLIDEYNKIFKKNCIIEHYGVFKKYNFELSDIFEKGGQFIVEGLDKSVAGSYFGKIYERLYFGNFIATPSVVINRKVLNEVGMFNENRLTQEDYELWLKIAKNHEWGYIDSELVRIRKRKNQLTSRLNNIEIAKNSLDIVLKETPNLINKLPIKKIKKRIKDRYLHLAVTYADNKRYKEAVIIFLKTIKGGFMKIIFKKE